MMSNSTKIYDVLVIGGGPAALAELIQLCETSLDVAVVSERFGGCMDMLGDQRLQSYFPELVIAGAPVALEEFMASRTAHSPTGREYTNYIRACFERIGAKKIISRVTSIEKKDRLFAVTLAGSWQSDRLFARKVILATGLRPKRPDPGIPAKYWTTCFQAYRDIALEQLERYEGRNLCIVGSGNTAFQLAGALARVAKDITLLINRYVGLFPIESSDRFSLRAPSMPTIELVVKSTDPKTSLGPLNSVQVSMSPIWLHAFQNLGYDAESKMVFADIPASINDHPVLENSVISATKNGRLVASSDGNYLWRRSLLDTTLISAIGVTADIPQIPWPNLVDTSTGFARHLNGETEIEGLFVTGASAGYASVNQMIPAGASVVAEKRYFVVSG